MQLGWAESVITPPEGTWMGGFASRKGPSEGIRDDLLAQVAWLRSAHRDQVIIALDLLGVTEEWLRNLRECLSAELGLKPEHVLLNCSHGHCGPVVRPMISAYDHMIYPAEYHERLVGVVLQLCQAARDDLEPVQFCFGRGTCDMAVSRRLVRADGRDHSHPHPFGPVDHDLPVLAARRHDGAWKLVVFSYACHPTVTDNPLFSAEFPGVARRLITERVGGTPVMFLQGCCGDTMVGIVGGDGHRYRKHDQWEDMEAAGRQVAWKVVLTLAYQMMPVHGEELLGAAMVQNLRFEQYPSRADLEQAAYSEHPWISGWARGILSGTAGEPAWPDAVAAHFTALRVGDVYLMGLPGEVACEYGLKLKQRHVGLRLMTLGYCQAMIGYIPRRSWYDEGGYEVDLAWRFPGYPSRWDRSVEPIFESAGEHLIRNLQSAHG